MARPEDSDAQVIRQVQEGNPQAYRILVDRYKERSFSLACRILPHLPDAEDALQESFIKAYRGLARFRGQARFSTWFYRIVLHTCYDRRAQLKRKPSSDHQASQVCEHLAASQSGPHPKDQQDRQKIIRQIPGLLKEEEALLLHLYYLSELSLAEIQEVTGFKKSRIKVSLHRARNHFRLQLERQFGPTIKHEL